MDVMAVFHAANTAVSKARQGGGPTLLEAKTYRFGGHYIGDIETRPKEEREMWMQRDPVKSFRSALISGGMISELELGTIDSEIDKEIESAMDFAQKSPYPSNDTALRDVFYDRPDRKDEEPAKGELGNRIISLREALSEGLTEELQRDPTVISYGVGFSSRRGGAFAVGKGLQDTFGMSRIRDAPISELTLVSAGLGAALAGLRPVVEIQFMDFTTLIADPIVNQVTKVRYASGGQFRVPLVIRTAFGAQGAGGPQHSQSLEAWYLHIPGIKVIIPSTPYDAKGLLKSAIRDDNPCLFLEHKAIYSLKGAVPEKDYTIPLGKADVKREGRDLTIVTWGKMVHSSLTAAEELQEKGISAEVIDIRCLVPLDKQKILDSVMKTGRALLVHEANKTGGGGAEISAIIVEQAFAYLRGPVMRVAMPDVIIPYSPPLENFILPNEAKIVAAAKELFSSTR